MITYEQSQRAFVATIGVACIIAGIVAGWCVGDWSLSGDNAYIRTLSEAVAAAVVGGLALAVGVVLAAGAWRR